ncbi:MAG: nucleotidyltransferase family protein [Bacteroidetes bacterium]|nr:MAG: nucleotidyltransferase family protein [Bacteroidota bacterium]
MPARPTVSVILLAAGESRRMGDANKLLLPFQGRPLIEHVVRALTNADVDETVVVLGHEAERIRPVLAAYPVRTVLNPDYTAGMTTSIRAGVRAAAADGDGFMICLSDLPLIEAAEFTYLANAFRKALATDPQCIVRPVYEGRPGNPVLFSAAYRPAIEAHEAVTGCRGLIKRHRTHVIEVPMATDHVVRDIDTPEAYATLTATTRSS